MKKLFLTFIILFAALSSVAQNPKREMRGAWIQCVNGQFQGMGKDEMQAT